ncbi:MAG: hypothetical protein AABY01_00585 [Nanoarchaeota archaeon]
MNDNYSSAKGTAESTGTAATMKFREVLRRFIFWGTMIVLLVVGTIFFAGWLEKPVQHPVGQSLQQTCPSSNETDINRCMITKAGVLVKSEPSINPREFEFCWVRPEGSIIESKWLGPDLLQIKSGGDDFQIEYKWMRKSDLVGGKCPNKF